MRIIFHTGIVTIDRIVDATTSFVANISSQPYFDARMLVVAPAGIAVRMTHTPVDVYKRQEYNIR